MFSLTTWCDKPMPRGTRPPVAARTVSAWAARMNGCRGYVGTTPVASSRARMFRPSRPMMRPFRSSLGRSTTETVVSMA